jgi:hypothetical protein
MSKTEMLLKNPVALSSTSIWNPTQILGWIPHERVNGNGVLLLAKHSLFAKGYEEFSGCSSNEPHTSIK